MGYLAGHDSASTVDVYSPLHGALLSGFRLVPPGGLWPYGVYLQNAQSAVAVVTDLSIIRTKGFRCMNPVTAITFSCVAIHFPCCV